ncbi:MAG: BMP family ABC transporter substrate-binding protein [Candidatus Odinarchaeota archaeon]
MKKKATLFSSLVLVIFCLTINQSSSVFESQAARLTTPNDTQELFVGVIFEDNYYYHESYAEAFMEALDNVKTKLNATLNITILEPSSLQFINNMSSELFRELRKTEIEYFYYDIYANASSAYNADVIIGVGRDLTDPIREYANWSMFEGLNKSFLLIDRLPTYGINENLTNVVSVSFNETEGAFLAGVDAANRVDTSINKFGIILDFNSLWSFRWPMEQQLISGFTAGVKYARGHQPVDFYIENIGKDHWDNITATEYQNRAKTKADEMFSNGVGVILAATGNGDPGIYQSAEQNSGIVIGMNGNENGESPAVLTSIIKNFTAPLYEYFSRYDELKGDGQVDFLEYGIANDGVLLTDMSLVNDTVYMFKTQGFVIPHYETAMVPGFEWLVAVIPVTLAGEIWRRKRK